MLYDENRDRILYQDGSSEFSVDEYCHRIIKGELRNQDYCIDSYDSDLFETYYGESITIKDTPQWPNDQKEYTDGELAFIRKHIYQSKRYKGTDQEHKRIDKEMNFFEESNNIRQVKKLVHLIEKFKETGVVWGVGRGSSCASYVFYLLEVHDVDPITHQIPFEEMSKEEAA